MTVASRKPSLRPGVVASKTRPNEGLRLSGRYGIRVGLIFTMAAMIVFALIFSLGKTLTIDLWTGVRLAVPLEATMGLMAFLWYGGIEILHHTILRMMRLREGSILRRYSAFLDHAVDLIFLCRVGGGYIFVHQLLQEYFAKNH